MSGDHRYRRLSDHRTARHSRRTSRKEAQQSLQLAECLRKDHPGTEGGISRTDSGTTGHEELCVRRGGYERVILGLDVLWAYDASVDLGRHLLWLGQEEVTLWGPGFRQKSARLSLAADEVIPARCERVMIAKLEAPVGRPTSSCNPARTVPKGCLKPGS